MALNKNNGSGEQLSKKELAQAAAEEAKEINARLDKNYDGYYDDVKPAPEKRRKNEIDKETIKKIALIAVGGIAVIGFCVFLIIK